MPQAAVECGAIATVTVVNQKPWWQSIPRAALHYLLRHQLGSAFDPKADFRWLSVG
jgi:hypothetical protein